MRLVARTLFGIGIAASVNAVTPLEICAAGALVGIGAFGWSDKRHSH